MTTFVNLTPHAVSVSGCTAPDGTTDRTWTLSPSGRIARAVEHVEAAAPIEGIPTIRVRFDGVVDLPDPQWRDLPNPCADVPDDGLTCPVCGASSGHYPVPKAPAVYYVVSLVTAQAARATGRTVEDLLTPGQQIRDEHGRVIGCGSLARVTRGA